MKVSLAKQRHSLVAVFGQHGGGDGDGVVARVEAEGGGKPLAGLLERAGIHLARALLEEGHHQVDGAALALAVEVAAAANVDLQRREGDGVLLYQPGLDAAGGGDLLDLHRRLSGCGPEGQNGGDEGSDHWDASSAGADAGVGAAWAAVSGDET
jgi:hypothetical protein